MARALAGLGIVYLAQKEHEPALSAFTEALDIARRSSHRGTIARVLNDLGEAFEAIGNDDEALRHHNEALGVRQKDGYRPAETTSLLAPARIYERRGDHARAINVAQRALIIATELGLKPRIAQCHDLLATAYEDAGDLASALYHLRCCEKVKSDLAIERSAMRYTAAVHEADLEAVQRQTELNSLATLGSLVAAISHEINSPLGAIQSSADIAARAAEKLVESHDAKFAEVLQTNTCMIGDGTRRIAEVVGRLKVFAGIDQSEFAPIDLVSAIKDVVLLLRPEFDAEVAVAVEHDLEPLINASATELRQVFLILLRNARQSIDGSGNAWIRISVDERWIQVAFTDTGTGIPSDVLAHLFSPSFRPRDNRVRASLSLFTCMAIVKKHGGTINVQSRPGEGSTFTVVLPRTLERTQSEPDVTH